MKNGMIVVLGASLAIGSAAIAAEPGRPLPAWLQAKIGVLDKLPPASPPRFFARTRYQGRTAYYLSPTCCDIPSELYDEAGVLLCHPDGGFAGGDGRCASFTLIGNAPAVVWRQAKPKRPAASAPAR
jgi:hypothetical protein